MSLLAVGVSHRTAPVALLERFAMGPSDTVKALQELVESDHVREVVLLATCNRVEVFADVDRFHGGVADVSRVLARHAGASIEEVAPYVTVHYEDQAAAHLFRVAAGLDSMVVGETQVLGQLRAAYALARKEGTVGRELHTVTQHALRVGKRVHAETGIDRTGASLVSVALDEVEQRIGALAGRTALVVGAGSMGALAATTLARRGARVAVISRTHPAAHRLAESVGGRTTSMDRLADELRQVDLLVSCTGAHGVIVPADVVAECLPDRAGRPLAVVDLALPHDVDPRVAGLPGVHLVGLARLQHEGSGAGALAGNDVATAVDLIDAEVAVLRAEQQAAAVAPTVSALRSSAARIVEAELLRLSTRLPDLDARARNEIARTVNRVVDKLLHQPTVRIKELAREPGGTNYADALRALFGLRIDAEVDAGRGTLADAVTAGPDLPPGTLPPVGPP